MSPQLQRYLNLVDSIIENMEAIQEYFDYTFSTDLNSDIESCSTKLGSAISDLNELSQMWDDEYEQSDTEEEDGDILTPLEMVVSSRKTLAAVRSSLEINAIKIRDFMEGFDSTIHRLLKLEKKLSSNST